MRLFGSGGGRLQQDGSARQRGRVCGPGGRRWVSGTWKTRGDFRAKGAVGDGLVCVCVCGFLGGPLGMA